MRLKWSREVAGDVLKKTPSYVELGYSNPKNILFKFCDCMTVWSLGFLREERIRCKYPCGPHKEWRSHYSYPGTKLIGQSRPYCGCMSNAGPWLLQVLRTEASSSCQRHVKYQIAWWHVFEKRASQQSANCLQAVALLKMRVVTAGSLIKIIWPAVFSDSLLCDTSSCR